LAKAFVSKKHDMSLLHSGSESIHQKLSACKEGFLAIIGKFNCCLEKCSTHFRSRPNSCHKIFMSFFCV
jgi:hypothetical protein